MFCDACDPQPVDAAFTRYLKSFCESCTEKQLATRPIAAALQSTIAQAIREDATAVKFNAIDDYGCVEIQVTGQWRLIGKMKHRIFNLVIRELETIAANQTPANVWIHGQAVAAMKFFSLSKTRIDFELTPLVVGHDHGK